MGKRKRKTTRRNRSLSSGGTRKRRRSSARRRGGLSEGLMDNQKPTIGQAARKTIGSASGGLLAIGANKLIPQTWPKILVVLGTLGLGFGAAMLGMPSTGAGFTGGMIALKFQNGLMGEDANYANNNSLTESPLFLDEDGNAMVMEEGEGGEVGYRYLSDDEIRQFEKAGALAEYEIVQD